MTGTLTMKKIVSPCLKLFSSSDPDVEDGAVRRPEKLLWYKDLGQHAAGEFSMAVVQANNLLEDGSEIESGPLSLGGGAVPEGTFVGVYDGHCGPETSRYIRDHLFQNLKRFSSEQHGMSGDVIRQAFSATEEGFLSIVRSEWLDKPQIAAVGSCCLVGVICGGFLYIANAGDSRVVLGRFEKDNTDVSAVQLSVEHNASYESVRNELRSLHPQDSKIVVLKRKVWRVKGLLQGIARRLIKAALQQAAKKKEMSYSELKRIGRGIRRYFHDDITVIVLFLDPTLISKSFGHIPVVSLKGRGVPV